MARREAVAASELAHLREDSLRAVLLGVAGGAYAWCAILLCANDRFGAAFRGPVLLTGGLAAALLTRKRSPSLAAALLIVGMAVAELDGMWLGGMRLAPYLLSLVVALTGLMFNLRAVATMTVTCSALIIAIGSLHWGYALNSPELLAPVLVTGAVGILSALSVRNLYLALYWAWDRTMAAQRNEKELRERRAELVRTAKALDEACHRLEYLNFDLAQAREAAEEARRLKQQFTTNVSHELRTPLNVIVTFSEMMYMSPQSYGGVPLPTEYVGDVREMYRASQHLLCLIDDVLDLSQIEAQRMKTHLEPAALAEVVAEAVGIARPLLRGKKVELRVEVPADLSLVSIDRARVRQVLLNLLSNARRFTERGTITVRAAREGAWVRVTVADTGIGIAPADHGRVFEEFRQLDASTTRKHDGTGLGLAISKRFVEMHGGRIWVESDGLPGHGSQFHFTLPVAGAGAPEGGGLRRTPLKLAAPSGRGRSILVLDQDPAVVRLLEQGLEEYHVEAVSDLAQALALAGELQPRAVLLNSAQGRQAWRQARLLREQLGQSAVPIILCPLVGERQLGRALGVMEYLVKPISRGALVALLDRLGDGVRRVLIVDDDPQMARLLTRMIGSARRGYQVERAYGASEALARMGRQHPGLVLLDLVMPEMDGYALLARMRESTDLREVPIAVITAQETRPEEERRLGGGVLQVTSGAGFTNEEALLFLRGILDAAAAPAPLQTADQAGEGGEELGLGDGLVQVGDGAQ